MGLMRFVVHEKQRLPESHMGRIYVAGPDELPFAGHAYWSGDQLVVERRDDGSGSFWSPWTLEGHGEWLIGSCTLMERERPYLLEVELARGTLFRLRNQLAAWELLGLDVPDALKEDVLEATRTFSRAATRQDKPAEAAKHANESLKQSADAAVALAAVYASQALQVRLANVEKLPTLIGVRIDEPTTNPAVAQRITEAFSVAGVPFSWRSVEASEGKRNWKTDDHRVRWAQNLGMRVSGGPLLEFDDRAIPEWAYLWEGDFEALSGLMLSHVEEAVRRYAGRVQLWNIASRVNRGRILSLSPEQRLQVVAQAVRRTKELDPKTPVVVSFDQPWAEYNIQEGSEQSPLDFADALERADLGIAGFGLELNLGYQPHGTSPRSPLAYSRLLDQWSLQLELPLMLILTAPSSADEDPHKVGAAEVVAAGIAGNGQLPADAGNLQARWVESCMPMLIAKNCVQVVMWNQYRDDQPHPYPHSGLVDAEGGEKPALEAIRKLRQQYLV